MISVRFGDPRYWQEGISECCMTANGLRLAEKQEGKIATGDLGLLPLGTHQNVGSEIHSRGTVTERI